VSVTCYAALPFERTTGGGLVPAEAQEAPSAAVAQRLALCFSMIKAGAVALSWTGDPDTGEVEEAMVIAQYGAVPDE
jgi:hypothetical protein